MTDEVLEDYFSRAADAGLSGIFLECHGGYPEVLGDSTAFRDSAALVILRRAVPVAQKYGLELHAWMWTTNRCEHALLEAHPDWYEVNGLGESLAEIEMYNRKHYRFLCPTHEGVAEYLKDRVRELAEVEGLTGIHLDFIRYPDAILPYGLHESRGVVQDKVYPQWDCCYCDECRAAFKAQTGIDPLELEDPTACPEWMQFRWDAMARLADGLLAEIRACGKVASAAVFATPEESRKLVRQDWVQFRHADALLPMIYYSSYAQPREWVETASREGVEALLPPATRHASTPACPSPATATSASASPWPAPAAPTASVSSPSKASPATPNTGPPSKKPSPKSNSNVRHSLLRKNCFFAGHFSKKACNFAVFICIA